ncbi:MAG: DUF1326 domain-containing protein [Chloroflexi bacterium]|nr:MAG: DUF1326 domain-containing protein [Chloroflexota bacterium]
MVLAQETPAKADVVYHLQGTLLEACSCGTLCPCWIGEDPDLGTCSAVIAYHFDKGEIRGVDVSGVDMAAAAFIPGNVLAGNWRMVMFIDEKASDDQVNALLDAYTGKLGGPLEDLAKLIGEVVAVERAPIVHELHEGKGTLRVGDGLISSTMEPYRGPDGSTTLLVNSVFSTIPGSPAWVSKADNTTVKLSKYGFEWSFDGRNAIQGVYDMKHTG